MVTSLSKAQEKRPLKSAKLFVNWRPTNSLGAVYVAVALMLAELPCLKAAATPTAKSSLPVEIEPLKVLKSVASTAPSTVA